MNAILLIRTNQSLFNMYGMHFETDETTSTSSMNFLDLIILSVCALPCLASLLVPRCSSAPLGHYYDPFNRHHIRNQGNLRTKRGVYKYVAKFLTRSKDVLGIYPSLRMAYQDVGQFWSIGHDDDSNSPITKEQFLQLMQYQEQKLAQQAQQAEQQKQLQDQETPFHQSNWLPIGLAIIAINLLVWLAVRQKQKTAKNRRQIRRKYQSSGSRSSSSHSPRRSKKRSKRRKKSSRRTRRRRV